MLKQNYGCVTGFNKLLKEGKFHSSTLSKHLKEMKKHNLITISKEGRSRNGKRKYCLVQPHLESLLNDLTAPLKSMNNELKRKDLNPDERTFLLENKIRLTYYKFNAFNIAKLFAEFVESNPWRLKIIGKVTDEMWKIIVDTIKEIPKKERERLINMLFEAPPKILSLIEYKTLRGTRN